MSKVVDKPRPSNPLDEIIAHTPHEPRSVGEGPNGGLALWEPWALDTLGTGCLQRPKAVAARLVVVQRVGAPERVAKIQRACVRNSECGRMRGGAYLLRGYLAWRSRGVELCRGVRRWHAQ